MQIVGKRRASPAAAAAALAWAWLLCAGAAQGSSARNLALGRPYRLQPPPNYRLCTDPDDLKQLTDGKTTSAYFWTQRGTVGWQGAPYVAITVDLGRTEPIGGAAMTTAAGTAGVTWPLAVQILVSEDGKKFYDAGDLAALDRRERGPWPKGYAIRRLETRALRARGRFVQFVIIPPPGGAYVFTDEVEVFRGPDSLTAAKPGGGAPTTARKIYEERRLELAVRRRWEADAAALAAQIRKAKLAPATKRRLRQRLEALNRSGPDPVDKPEAFRAILPFGPRHAELFRIQATLWRALGADPLAAWTPRSPWDPVPLFALPPWPNTGAVEIDAMRGECRAGAINLANSGEKPISIRLWFEGLPGGPTPDCLAVREAVWTDTSLGEPVAAALPPARRDGRAWRIQAAPGLIRQVWLVFRPQTLAPGLRVGRLVAEMPDGRRLSVPARLRVWPMEFPKQTALWVGGWSYTDGEGAYGLTSRNRKAFLEHLQSRCVNAPWATSAAMLQFTWDEKGKIRINTRRFDDWIAQWPNAKAYLVFLSIADYSATLKSRFRGAEAGSPEFNRLVGAWIRAWTRHLRSKGIAPNRLGLLLHDEPREGSDITALLAWARAIRAAAPEVLIWEDPTYRNPADAPAELFEVCDVLCPNRPMWLARGESFARFYLKQRDRGRTLQFYSCSGPAKLLDPYSYYRLQAWHCRATGGTGSFFWAFGDNGGASSWNEFFAQHGPYTPLFLDPDGVVPAKQMEAIRESAEDYEYFVMLEKAVKAARARGRRDDSLRRAERLLRTAPQEVLDAPGANRLRWREPKDRSPADRLRRELLKALAALGESAE